jgi:phosphoribosylformylglycinamidine cyclo-ligase
MQQLGELDTQDLFRTFNMGIGLIVILNERWVDELQKELLLFPEFKVQTIGRVVASETKSVRLV